MTQTELRNIVAKSLQKALGVQVILYQPDAPEPKGDYVYYVIVNPYIPYGQGGYINTPVPSMDPSFTHDVENKRIEQALAVYRFVAVSKSADNAQILAEKLQGFFVHTGELDLYLQGATTVEVTNPQDVTTFEIDSTLRLWSVDVTFRYTRVDIRTDPNIEKITFKQI